MSADNPITSARPMGEIYQNAIRQFMDRLEDRFNSTVEMLV